MIFSKFVVWKENIYNHVNHPGECYSSKLLGFVQTTTKRKEHAKTQGREQDKFSWNLESIVYSVNLGNMTKLNRQIHEIATVHKGTRKAI